MAGDFNSWIGRQEISAPDHLTPRLCDSFAATLAPHLANVDGAALGLHWCLAPPVVGAADLGEDGHPAKGGFLPPIPLPRRMWASGEVEFLRSLRPDDSIRRTSRIADIAWKQGKSGALCFVTVDHSIATPTAEVIRERQHIVFRPAATERAPSALPQTPAPVFDREWQVNVDPVMLFRYSAMTFNGHRIHYDAPYATGTEHYAGLVIHGPLQATLMLNLAAAHIGQMPRRFSFRGLSPAAGPQVLRVGVTSAQDKLDLAVVGADGVVTMTGQAT